MHEEMSSGAVARRGGRGSWNTPAWLIALAVLAACVGYAPVAAGCSARSATSFHLRPRAVVRSEGPELPAGTEVEVLATSDVHRRGGAEGFSPPVLSHVRVTSNGAEGYAFVGPRELKPGCPLLAPMAPALGAMARRIGHQWHVNYARSPGVEEIPAQRLTRWAAAFDAARDEVLARFDADHNGSEETLVRAHPDEGGPVIVLMREGVRGAPGIVVDQEWDHDHHSVQYGEVMRAGRVEYVAMDDWVVGLCFGCRDAQCDVSSRRLLRLHPDGWFVVVVNLPRESEGEALTLRGEPDGSVTVTGAVTGRTQRLRFDAATFALVPDGPTMPRIALTGGLCDQLGG